MPRVIMAIEGRRRLQIVAWCICALVLQGSLAGASECDGLMEEALKRFRAIDPAVSETSTYFRNTLLCANLNTIYAVKHQVFDIWAGESGNPDVDAARAAAIHAITELIPNVDPNRVKCGCTAKDVVGKGDGAAAPAHGPPERPPAEIARIATELHAASSSVKKLLPVGSHQWDLKLVASNPVLIHQPDDPDARPSILPCGFFGATPAPGPDGSWEAIRFDGRHLDGVEIASIAGLAVGATWALDVWVQYDPDALKRAEVTLLDGYADWMKGGDFEIRAINLELAIYSGDLDHGTGLHLPHSSSWHRLTMACASGNMVWYVNGTKLGAVRAHVLLRDPGEERQRASAVHSLGGSVTALDRGSGTSWLGRMWAPTFFTDADQDPETAIARKQKADVIRRTSLLETLEANAWAKGLATRRVVLVGNSARLLLDKDNTRKGNAIDGFDEVVRFNANPIDGFEVNLGARRNLEVINSLMDLCGCHAGECCTLRKKNEFWAMMRPRRQAGPANLIVLSHDVARQDWFQSGLLKYNVPSRVAPIPEFCGPAFNKWAEEHSVATRFPHWMKCRAGMRMLLLLLAYGGTPAVAGFDTAERTRGHMAELTVEEKDEARNAYYLEQQMLTELIRLGIVKAV
eukprot:jgi/Mesvir1/7093/Mv09201-RA.1